MKLIYDYSAKKHFYDDLINKSCWDAATFLYLFRHTYFLEQYWKDWWEGQ